MEYLGGDFVSAIYVLVPHLEGIVKTYLRKCQIIPNYRFESCLQQFRDLIQSRSLIMYPKQFLEAILEYLNKGPFLAETTKVGDPSKYVNRHGIAHGVFTGFESQEIALKYLLLLDGLSFLLVHDRMVSGSL